MKLQTKPLLLTYYGDDFTGSTDVMESLSASGIPTALFLEPPSPDELATFRLLRSRAGHDGRVSAFGVAGVSRTMTPEQMRETLPGIFRRIAAHPSRFFHYKICSTFDSAPSIGNLGVATDLALEAFPSEWVPLIAAAPALGRYCVFANLFARVGNETHRLDRHPTMARHPITPMAESDLRRHLAQLTDRVVRHVDVHALERHAVDGDATVPDFGRDRGFVLFDTLDERHLAAVGELICTRSKPLQQLVVGSSGVQAAICGHLTDSGERQALGHDEEGIGTVPGIIAMAGSASPGTARQIEHALRIGFADIRINTVALMDRASREVEISRIVALAAESIARGRSPMMYTAFGPDDPMIADTTQRAAEMGDRAASAASVIAGAQGEMLKRLLLQVGARRVVVAGGDTSGFAARALRIHALEMCRAIAPGAPLCRAHSADAALQGLQIALKGGQNGNERYFESILRGEVL